MSTHKVEISLTATFIMEEMDGTAEQSAEIMLGIVEEQIKDYDAEAQIECGDIRVEEMDS